MIFIKNKKHRNILVSNFILILILALSLSSMYLNKNNLNTVVQAQTSNIDWPQLQHDSQHTGYTAATVSPATIQPYFKAKWIWLDKTHIIKNFNSVANNSITTNYPGFISTVIFSGQMQPVVANGITYFGAMNGSMYAVNSITGDNIWDFASGGPILHTAAVDSGVLMFGSMDGYFYGLNALTGVKLWSYKTGAGISSAPVVLNGFAYIGSRDGKFYKFNVTTGSMVWSYSTRVEPANASSPQNLAPIVAPAVISEDGTVVMFGAENMFFYGLNVSDGSEKWAPVKMIGQSFLYSIPMVKDGKVFVRTMSSLGGTEYVMESVLDSLCNINATTHLCSTEPTWSAEKTAVNNWLASNPDQKSLYVLNISTGTEPYQVAMGRVSGNNYPSFPPVVDTNGRVLTYWRSARSYFFTDGGSYGTWHCPDFSQLDTTTGDRINLGTTPNTGGFCPELDNGFLATVGGTYLYLNNHFRGAKLMNLANRSPYWRISAPIAMWDGGDFRTWGDQIIYYGNDSAGVTTTVDPKAPQIYNNADGESGISIAKSGSTSMFYITESGVNAVVGVGNN